MSIPVEAVREEGLLVAGRPVVVLLSGGRDSTCLLDLAVRIAGAGAVSALHVNYGLRAEADADERHCAGLCERLGVELEVRRPAPPRDRKPPGLGARRALRRRGADRDPAPGRRRRRSHRHRSGRDDPLPAGVVAEPPRAAGYARHATARWSARCSITRASRPPRTARREACRGARTRATSRTPTPAGGSVRGWCPRCARSTPPPSRTCWRSPRSSATRRRCSTAAVDGVLDGSAEISLARLRALPEALRALVVQRLADGAAGRPAPGTARRAEEIVALPDHGRAALDLPARRPGRGRWRNGAVRADPAGAAGSPERHR